MSPLLRRDPAPIRDDRGATLILALIFLLVVSGVVLALSSAAANDLRNVKAFASARTLRAAESSATEVALYRVRYTPSSCTTTSPVVFTINGLTFDVYCSTVSTPLSSTSRVVTFYTCPSTVSEATCTLPPPNYPDLYAVATFDDYGPGLQTPVTTECVTLCGAGMTLTDWKFR